MNGNLEINDNPPVIKKKKKEDGGHHWRMEFLAILLCFDGFLLSLAITDSKVKKLSKLF